MKLVGALLAGIGTVNIFQKENEISYAKGYARVCMIWNICKCINNERLAKFGLISMLDYYTARCVTC